MDDARDRDGRPVPASWLRRLDRTVSELRACIESGPVPESPELGEALQHAASMLERWAESYQPTRLRVLRVVAPRAACALRLVHVETWTARGRS